MKRSRLTLLGLICGLVIGLCSAANAELLIKPNDRVVFYGDSITQQRLYTRYISQYLLCRYPEMNLTFVNAGWSGDTAPGGAKRLERDVLPLNPTIVTLFFGMNDGRYTTVNQGNTDNFRKGMDDIVAALKAKGIRVVVFSPGCVDPDRKKNLADCDYNTTLEGLGGAAAEVAKKYDVPFGDVIHPMLQFQTEQKAKDKAFTMIPDAVHPSPAGHLVMAQIMLKILGAEPMSALGTLDVASGQTTGLKLVSKEDDKWVVECSALAPFWIDPANVQVTKDCGFYDFAAPNLTVKGLPQGFYSLNNSKGISLGRFSAEQFAAGVPILGDSPDAGKPLHDIINFKEDQYFNAWRNILLPLADVPGARDTYNDMLKANESMGKLAQNLAKPVPTTLTLMSVGATANLALKCKYEASDPNKYNWGIGGLTDGSWAGKSPNCFATGDSATFPKDVTVDLGNTFKISQVDFGVPAFGSTKTVKVSISKDNKTFTDVGSYQFSQNKEEKTTIKFTPAEARYVRLTYADRYDQSVGYPITFAFTTELEVYGPGK